MKDTRTIQYIKLDNLVLDNNNPRFGELYVGNGTEEDLIRYLLHNEAGLEVAKGIVKADEFYIDRPLWVFKSGKNYIVKDGNRRCAAVKALQLPGVYGIDLPKMDFVQLPALVYENEDELNDRIFLEHANNTFRSWERIAKAQEVYRLFKSGTELKTMGELDSQPGQLIKLASFYKVAVIYGGDNLKKLLTRGRGKTGGRTIIFERLFKFAEKCGYKFKNSPSFEIVLTDQVKFESYVKSLIKLLEGDLEYIIKTDLIDSEKEGFMKRLKPFGFDYFYTPINDDNNISGNSDENNNDSSTDNSSNQESEENNPNQGTSSGTNNQNPSTNDNNTDGNTSSGKSGTKRGSVKTGHINFMGIKQKVFPF